MSRRLDEVEWKLDCLQSRMDALVKADEDPCWEGYEQAGTKEKDGRTVPNCVKADEVDGANLLCNKEPTRSDAVSLKSLQNQIKIAVEKTHGLKQLSPEWEKAVKEVRDLREQESRLKNEDRSYRWGPNN